MPRPFAAGVHGPWPAATGVDEVGRGCLAGAALVGAVWFDPTKIPADLLSALDDSKRLSAKRRTELAVQIRKHCLVSFAAASPRLIERLNIRGATLDAMRRAVLRLGAPGHIYIDGVDVPPGLNRPAAAVVKGDQTIPQIAAASIVAKDLRDRLMARLASRYPAYGWERNAGYGTATHYEAMKQVGPTLHHRPSFLRGR